MILNLLKNVLSYNFMFYNEKYLKIHTLTLFHYFLNNTNNSKNTDTVQMRAKSDNPSWFAKFGNQSPGLRVASRSSLFA